MTPETVRFCNIRKDQRGVLADLLLASYADLLAEPSGSWKGIARDLADFDREVFDHFDTIGRCVFLTMQETTIVGFASFDPRQRPDVGIIGHNCILPAYRRQGFGRGQVEEILSRFTCLGIRTAVVVTNEHSFFQAARRTYESCGFERSRQIVGGPDPRYAMIEYVKGLTLENACCQGKWEV